MSILKIDKIRAYVGFAIKSNKVLWGVDCIIDYRKKIHLVIVSDNINVTSMSRLNIYCKDKDVKIIVIDIGALRKLTNKDNCKAIAIIDYNLAKAIKDKFGVL